LHEVRATLVFEADVRAIADVAALVDDELERDQAPGAGASPRRLGRDLVATGGIGDERARDRSSGADEPAAFVVGPNREHGRSRDRLGRAAVDDLAVERS